MDACTFFSMTPRKNPADDPTPRRVQQDLKWQNDYKETKNILRNAQKLLPEADQIEEVKRNINLAKNDLNKILRWISSIKPDRESDFGSISYLQSKIEDAITELIVARSIITTHNKNESSVEKQAECIRNLQKALNQYKKCIDHALREFRR